MQNIRAPVMIVVAMIRREEAISYTYLLCDYFVVPPRNDDFIGAFRLKLLAISQMWMN